MDEWGTVYKIWFFMIFLIGIWLIQSGIKLFCMTSKQKREILIQERRQEFIYSKLFEKIKDSYDDEEIELLAGNYKGMNEEDEGNNGGQENRKGKNKSSFTLATVAQMGFGSLTGGKDLEGKTMEEKSM